MTALVTGARRDLGTHSSSWYKNKQVKRVKKRVAAVNLFASLVHLEPAEDSFNVAVAMYLVNNKESFVPLAHIRRTAGVAGDY